ncbi:1-deoxy-D-xylulose-5-phosphate reductoisomerase [Bacillus marinisedimentorum]|uniref:1-deoxy-D-xylulose-5-phosphate reductoisomerase n=1 Tax=Bacillus marinisedimentorum TaxID=1821260 RepID=UPI0007E106B5|nr:1-deoxy-D-xylulose-5-phosphate reductoisomerase [Bacillus marinisedimentorum]
MKNINLLGATGSIGTQTLDVIRAYPEQFSLSSMSVGRNIEKAIEIAREFNPRLISVLDEKDLDAMRSALPSATVMYGEEGLRETAVFDKGDVLVNAVMGSVGLEPTLMAIEAGKSIAIANKETLVTAGHLVVEKAKQHRVDLLPVDSEHSAIFQCLQGQDIDSVSRLILTASGGSFRDKSREELKDVNVESALNHPNWSMGAKITIDSATMMNKGLEVIEAHWLFGIPYEKIDVVLHKESIIHSMVEYEDTSVIAQLGTPDMKVPIQYALTYPKRLELPLAKRLNLWETGTLHFSEMDYSRFRCLKFAFDAGKAGGSMPAVMNAANEAAVQAFLDRKIPFLQIEDFIEKAMEQHKTIAAPDLETIRQIDRETRSFVTSLI